MYLSGCLIYDEDNLKLKKLWRGTSAAESPQELRSDKAKVPAQAATAYGGNQYGNHGRRYPHAGYFNATAGEDAEISGNQ